MSTVKKISIGPNGVAAHYPRVKKIVGSPESQRCIRLRKAMGYDYHGGQKKFAEFLGVSPDRWNNVERGVPLGKELAFIVEGKCPGVGAKWLWFGDIADLSVKMAQLLGEMPTAPTTSGSRSARHGS